MGEDSKKSFWTSMPGILTGIASVIGVIITLITTLHLVPVPSTTNVTSPSPPPLTPIIQSTSTSTQTVCGSQLPGINNLFDSWTWVGTNNGVTQSGLFTFKNDCTYTNAPQSGFNLSDEGSFIINKSPTTTIKLQSKSGNTHTYLINNIQNNSFHLYDLDNKVNLNFGRSSQ